MAGSIKNFLSKFSSKSKTEEDKFIHSTSVTLREDKHSCNPNKAWSVRKKSQTFKTLTPTDPSVPCKKGCARFVCISDTHTVLEKQGKDGLSIPDGDVLLHAGDFTMYGTPDEVALVNEYLGTLPHKYKIVIAGNHEVTFDLNLIHQIRSTRVWKLNKDNYEKRLQHYGVKTVHEMLTNCIYLQDSMVKVHGINIYGSPWQPGGGNWGFNCRRGMNLLEKWNDIPENTDILLTHGPPCGHGDNVNRSILKKVFDPRAYSSPHHVGCVDLSNTIQNRVRPKYHVFGHIHEGYGMTSDGTTTYINAAICDEHYRARNPPIVFDVPLHKKLKSSAKSDTEFEWVIPTVLPYIDTDSNSDNTESSDNENYCKAESEEDGHDKSDTKIKLSRYQYIDNDDDVIFSDNLDKESDIRVKPKIKVNLHKDDHGMLLNDEKRTNKTKGNISLNNDDDFIVFCDNQSDESETSSSSDDDNDGDNFDVKSNKECDKTVDNTKIDDNDDDFIVFCDEQSECSQGN